MHNVPWWRGHFHTIPRCRSHLQLENGYLDGSGQGQHIGWARKGRGNRSGNWTHVHRRWSDRFNRQDCDDVSESWNQDAQHHTNANAEHDLYHWCMECNSTEHARHFFVLQSRLYFHANQVEWMERTEDYRRCRPGGFHTMLRFSLRRIENGPIRRVRPAEYCIHLGGRHFNLEEKPFVRSGIDRHSMRSYRRPVYCVGRLGQ